MHSKPLAAALAAQSLLFFVPLFVLGQAIGWPASLRLPMGEQLALVHQHGDAVRFGYGVYFGLSLLFAFSGTALANAAGPSTPLLRFAAAAAIASSLARCVGILRWLTAMPLLAEAHTASPSSEAPVLVGQAIHAWGGAIGEVMGVSLLCAMWLGALCWETLRTKHMPRWLALGGLTVSVFVASPALSIVGVQTKALLTASSTALQVWLLACAWVVGRRPSVANTWRAGQVRS